MRNLIFLSSQAEKEGSGLLLPGAQTGCYSHSIPPNGEGGPCSDQLMRMAQTGTGVALMSGGLGQRHPAVLGSGDPCPSAVGRSQRVTTPHCSCGTTQISRAWGAPPTDSVLKPELDTPQSTSKRWLAFTGVSFS